MHTWAVIIASRCANLGSTGTPSRVEARTPRGRAPARETHRSSTRAASACSAASASTTEFGSFSVGGGGDLRVGDDGREEPGLLGSAVGQQRIPIGSILLPAHRHPTRHRARWARRCISTVFAQRLADSVDDSIDVGSGQRRMHGKREHLTRRHARGRHRRVDHLRVPTVAVVVVHDPGIVDAGLDPARSEPRASASRWSCAASVTRTVY